MIATYKILLCRALYVTEFIDHDEDRHVKGPYFKIVYGVGARPWYHTTSFFKPSKALKVSVIIYMTEISSIVMQGNKKKVDWSCVEQFPFEYKWKTM